MWETSVYGGYVAVNYGSTATAYINSTLAFAPQGTSQDFLFWQVGSRTVWTPSKGLDLSVDMLYNHLNTAMSGLVPVLTSGNGKTPAQPYTIDDQASWQAIFRVQRNFYP